jgi:hypothetical protein
LGPASLIASRTFGDSTAENCFHAPRWGFQFRLPPFGGFALRLADDEGAAAAQDDYSIPTNLAVT